MKFRNHILALGFLMSLAFSGQLMAQEEKGNFSRMDSSLMQIQQKRADKKFEKLAYTEAIDRYEALFNKGYAPDSMQRNLALAYYKVHRTKDAERLFGSLAEADEAQAMELYYYAQALKSNEKYEEADVWMEKYSQVAEDDSRGVLQQQAAPAIKRICETSAYDIRPVDFNTANSDFGAVELGGRVYFASARNEQSVVPFRYSWKGQPYLDVFAISYGEGEASREVERLSTGVNSRHHDGPICFNPERTEVFVTRNSFKSGLATYNHEKENHFVLLSGRMDNGEWEDLEELPFNDQAFSCGHPAVSPDNQVLYFASDMPGGKGGSDLYAVTRQGEGWSEPMNLGSEINTEGDEMFPFVSSKGILYFSSNGHLGLGGLDVFKAVEIGENSHAVLNMGYPLNGPVDDFSFYLMGDGMTGYFASNRPGGMGDDDIYHFIMNNEPTLSHSLVLSTVDAESREVLPGSSVRVEDGKGVEVFSGNSDEEGRIQLEVLADQEYMIRAEQDNYQAYAGSYRVDPAHEENGIIQRDLELNSVKEWGVFGMISDKNSGEGVDGVRVLISTAGSTVPREMTTNEAGNFKMLLEPESDYDILISKPKYFTRRGAFSTRGMNPGWINADEFIELQMEEIVVGKTIEIPNIYYDLAKWNIRDDAAVELDKVVQFLLDNESISIELGSHTDARGTNTSNQSLSQKRAESAVRYIVTHGVDASRITAKGYGESRLKNRCADGVRCSEEEHQANRRTEIMIVDF